MKRALILSTALLAAAVALPASAQLLGGQGSVTGNTAGGLTGSVQGQAKVDPSATIDSATVTANNAKADVEATASNAYNTANRAKDQATATTQSTLDTAAQQAPSADANATVSGDVNAASDGVSANVGAQTDARVEKKQ